jgi:VanZ family protein
MTRSWRTGAIVFALLLVVLAISLSPDSIRWLRTEVPLANLGLGWLELKSVRLNATHVALFFLVGLVVACALFPGMRLWRVGLLGLLLLLAISIATEAMQLVIPGRTARLSDIRDNMLGGVPGLLLGLALRAVWRFLFRVRPS